MKYIVMTIVSSMLSIFGTILILSMRPDLLPNGHSLNFKDDNKNTRVAMGKFQLDRSGIAYGLSFHDSAGNVRMILGTKEDDSPFIVLQNEDLSYAGGINMALGHIQLLLGSINGSYVQLGAPHDLNSKSDPFSFINIAGGREVKSEIALLASDKPSVVIQSDSYKSLIALRLSESYPSIIVKKFGNEVFKTAD